MSSRSRSHYDEEDQLLLNHPPPPKGCWAGFVSRHRWVPCCCATFVGLILVILSLQLAFVPQLFTKILHDGLEDALIFHYARPHDSSYKTFLSNTGSNGVPIWMEVRYFNVTNPDEVLRGEYPQFEQSGALVYNEYQVKSDVNFSDDGEWVSYTTETYYTFNEERSEISRDTQFIVFSPLIPALYQAREEGYFCELLENNQSTKFFPCWKSDEEVDAIFEFISIFADELLFLNGTAEELAFSVPFHLGIPVGNDTYTIYLPGGLLGSNASSETETMNTGYKDKSRIGEVKEWQGSEWVSCWNPALPLSPGHDDYFGMWTIEKGGTLDVWVDSLFVNLVLEYNQVTHYHGLELYEYHVQIEPQFLNSTQWPPNALYYAYGPSGVLNLTSCFSGIPFFVSLPYFLGGADYAANLSLMGLPNISWSQQPFVSVDPVTGVIFNANKSLQINTQIRPLPEEWDVLDEEDYAALDAIDAMDAMDAEEEVEDVEDVGKRRTPAPTASTAAPTAGPTGAPTTPTQSPTAAPTAPTTNPTPKPTKQPRKSLKNVPYLMVPIVESSECEGLTQSQAKAFASEVYDTEKFIQILKYVGYVATPLLVLYTWWLCYWFGKRRARIKKM